MSDREVRDQLMTLLLAGHETTATGLAWTLDLLDPPPGRCSSARASDGDDVPARGVAESLRLRPVVPLAGRRLAAAAGRRRRRCRPAPTSRPRSGSPTPARTSTPSPYAFRPERFLDRPPSTYTWIPFGGGVRRCLGAASPRWRCGSCSATILRRFDLRAASRRAERVARRNVTFSPRHGTRVIATRRR